MTRAALRRVIGRLRGGIIGGGLAVATSHPSGYPLEPTGTVYVVDNGNKRVVKLAAGSSAPTVLPFTGLDHPWGVVVDSTGTVYVTDPTIDRVLKLAAGSSTQTEMPFTGFNHPWGVAVDSSGTVYVTDQTNRVLKLPVQ